MTVANVAETNTIPFVLRAVREATGTAHGRLEARMPFARQHLSHALYRRLIEAYHGFYAELEGRLQAFAGEAPLLAGRLKTPVLLRDLQALGVDSALAERLPRPRRLPQVTSHADWMGVMYVLEGATLGGQVLKRLMHERLAIDADNGGAFLDVYGVDTGRRWRAFLAELTQIEAPEQVRRVSAAALDTFLCFEAWLDHNQLLHDAEPT